VIEILRGGISETLYALQKASVTDLGPTDVLVPDGFVVDQDVGDGGR
jgi:hypothetical protein